VSFRTYYASSLMRLRALASMRFAVCARNRHGFGCVCCAHAYAQELAGFATSRRPSRSWQLCSSRRPSAWLWKNLNTGISLPDIDGTVAFMRLGLAVDQLEAIGWLRRAQRHLYWGDFDTHGFAILARARLRFPNTVSVLMDEDTLLAHRKLWVREPTPCRVESPEGLTVAELAVYEGVACQPMGRAGSPRAGAHRVAGGAGGHLQRTWKSPISSTKLGGPRSKTMELFCCAPGLAKPANLLRR
jgi:hypothetical protein